MVKYGKNIIFNPEGLHPFSIDRQSTSLIPVKSKVLDIGCATGFMGEYLSREKGCYVVGVEMGKSEAREARKHMHTIIEGDIENKETVKSIAEKFDVILASAIIEHLKDPWSTVKSWKPLLKKDGFIIVTTPNIAHWSTRFQLLRGKFEYQQYGILDNTHLRFFTTQTFKQLFKDCGYTINVFAIDAVGGGYPRISEPLSHLFPNMFAYQMLVKATPQHES